MQRKPKKNAVAKADPAPPQVATQTQVVPQATPEVTATVAVGTRPKMFIDDVKNMFNEVVGHMPRKYWDSIIIQFVVFKSFCLAVGRGCATWTIAGTGCGEDLSKGWELLDPSTHMFTKERYNACPTIRYLPSDGHVTILC